MNKKIEEGRKKVSWAKKYMPVLKKIRKRFRKERPLEGLTVGMALHVEPKTAVLVETINEAGSKVQITGCNPLSTQDDVSIYLDSFKEINSYAKRGIDQKGYYKALDKVLEERPEVLIDDGGDLVFRVHKKGKKLLKQVIGGCEETTTGVHRLKSMDKENELKIPVVAVNDTPMKRDFDNRHGTGESTLNSIMSTTNLQVSGKNVVIAGYGYCGKGLAEKFSALGAKVTVTEIDPKKALQAFFKGFQVTSMEKAANFGEIFVTTTGNINVIDKEHLEKMKDGAIVCNAGHFNVEINLESLKKLSIDFEQPRPGVKEYILPNGKKISVLAEGRLVNLASPLGWGHPVEIMDLSFALQALSVEYLVKERPEAGVLRVPEEIDRMVAELKLEVEDIETDSLTDEQEDYLESWQHGT